MNDEPQENLNVLHFLQRRSERVASQRRNSADHQQTNHARGRKPIRGRRGRSKTVAFSHAEVISSRRASLDQPGTSNTQRILRSNAHIPRSVSESPLSRSTRSLEDLTNSQTQSSHDSQNNQIHELNLSEPTAHISLQNNFDSHSVSFSSPSVEHTQQRHQS